MLDILDAVRAPHVVVDSNFRVRHANDAFLRAFDLARPEMMHEPLFAIGDGQWDIQPFRELLADVFSSGLPCPAVVVDHEFRRVGRKTIVVDAVLVPQGPDGTPVLLLTIEDITERRLTERRLAEQRQELQRSNDALGEFASVASHDLQEPLRKILSFGERLNASAGHALEGDSRLYLERMLGAAARMRTLINDLLTYSQITNRRQSFASMNLTATAGEVIADLETAIAEASGTVEVGELPVLEADPFLMRQLFQNLIGNALKYRRAGQPAIVRLSGENLQGEHRTITVTDNGIGFQPAYAEKIFHMFERLHGRAEFGGSGIGLAICRRIVDRHGGTITATSAPGRGATFTVTLPATQAAVGFAR